MKIKRNVKAPICIRGRKYKELWEAIGETPMDSWIEVDFEKLVAQKHKAAIYNMPGNGTVFKLRVIATDDPNKIKIGKFPIE